MADSVQLARIAKKIRAIGDFTVQEVPKLPDWFVRQFKLEDYATEWERWRQNTQVQMRDALSSTKDLNNLVLFGTGSPEGRISSTPGKIYLNLSGGVGQTLFVKETGTDVDGWNPVSGSGGGQNILSGDGSPENVRIGDFLGQPYTDVTNGDFYVFTGTAGMKTGWTLISTGPVVGTDFILSGSGSPEGSVIGEFHGQPYTDITTGGLYVFTGTVGSTNGWV